MTALAAPVPNAAAVPQRKATTRHGMTDVLRVVAVGLIVFYHGDVLAQLPALVGMHALIVASVVFAARPSKGVGRRLSRQTGRPPAAAVAGIRRAALRAGCENHALRPWMFVIGGSLHLWFVPFIFVATCGVALACRRRGRATGWGRAAFWFAATVMLAHVEAPLRRRSSTAYRFGSSSTALRPCSPRSRC